MLLPFKQENRIEVGCDEAGRGCLAGPVVAAAVILPPQFSNSLLNDSKQLHEKHRNELKAIIEAEAIDFAIAVVDIETIDRINILQASIQAMHQALLQLGKPFDHILVDGNRFKPFGTKTFDCEIKGDGRYMCIAAASILAKTYRDAYMLELHQQFPQYHWNQNKGYPTASHRKAISKYGATSYHRKTFNLLGNNQPELF